MCLILNIMPEKQVSAIQAELSDFANGGMFAEDNLLLDMLWSESEMSCSYDADMLFCLASSVVSKTKITDSFMFELKINEKAR